MTVEKQSSGSAEIDNNSLDKIFFHAIIKVPKNFRQGEKTWTIIMTSAQESRDCEKKRG